jgi:hypothetical protein
MANPTLPQTSPGAMTVAAILERTDIALGASGLVRLGLLGPEAAADLPDRPGPFTLVLAGNAGPEMWRAFSAAPEFGTDPDPLDRWTRRMLTGIAGELGAEALFPFDGPPYWPFQRWALAAGGFSASPMGVLVHGTWGPWFAFRGALLVPGDIRAEAGGGGPCDACDTRPCLSPCPVGAIGPGRPYDVGPCRAHVAAGDPGSCAGLGCLARHACPVGRDFAYAPDQARHHMAAFAK